MQTDEQEDGGLNLDWLVRYSPKDVIRSKTFHIFQDQPFISFAVPICIDRLLVEWLKLDRLETDESHIVGSVFSQSRKNNPHGFFSVAISNSKTVNSFNHGDKKYQVLHRPNPQYIGAQHCWIEIQTEYREQHYRDSLFVSLTRHFPFLFVRIPPSYQYLSESDVCAKTFDVGENSFCDDSLQSTNVNIKVLPTSDPSVFLIIVSSVLETEKDCAKLLRSFVKKDLPSSWNLNSAFSLPANFHVSLQFKYPCVYSSTQLVLRRDYFPSSKNKLTFANLVLAGVVDFDLPAMVHYDCFDVSELLNE